MSVQRCRICGSDRLATFALGGTPLVRCGVCDVVYQARFPSDEELAEYYRNTYQINKNVDETAIERRRMFRLPEQVKIIADIRRLKPPPADILDVGCDVGAFLDEARHHGYNISGVEPSEFGRAYCSHLGIPVVADISEVTGAFDIATMHHALEHIANPVETLQRIHRTLKPGGVLLVRVPNFDSFWRRVFGRHWSWFQPMAHYFHYSPASLRHLLNTTGFDPRTVRSQRPNNRLTLRANRLANASYRRYFHLGVSWRKRLGRRYEDLTGIEVYAIAIKR